MTAPSGYSELIPGVIRGPRPTEAVLLKFDPMLRTVVDLEPLRIEAGEETIAQKLGIREVAIPMSSIWPPSLKDVQLAAAVMDSPDGRPCLTHCHAGVDRTGIVSGYFNVRYLGMSPTAALDDMFAHGYHWIRYGALGWTRAAMAMFVEAVKARGA